MVEAVYALCVFTSLVCAVLLFKAHRGTHASLLFWSGLCFAGLAVDDSLLLLDTLVGPSLDLRLPRTGTAASSLAMMLYGLIEESR